jgi:hypothetical protein
VALVSHVRARRDHASTLAPTDGEINTVYVTERKATQDQVAIPADFEAMFGRVGKIWHFERSAQHLRLIVHTRARHALGDFLEQSDLRLLIAQNRDDSLEVVATVDAANAFVDVPAHDPNAHPWPSMA